MIIKAWGYTQHIQNSEKTLSRLKQRTSISQEFLNVHSGGVFANTVILVVLQLFKNIFINTKLLKI